MKFIIYCIAFSVFLYFTELSSHLIFNSVISPLLAGVFFLLIIIKLSSLPNSMGAHSTGSGSSGGGFWGGSSGGDGGCGGDGGGC